MEGSVMNSPQNLKAGDLVNCIDGAFVEGDLPWLCGNWRGDLPLSSKHENSFNLELGQEVWIATGIPRQLKQAVVTNYSAGTDNQGDEFAELNIDGIIVYVPVDRIFFKPTKE